MTKHPLASLFLGLIVTTSAFAGPFECYKAASNEMEKVAAVRLCSQTKNSLEPVKCVREAKKVLPAWEAITLCAGTDSAKETLRCYEQSSAELSEHVLASLRLCGKGIGL